jgi:hypothetical protein
MSNCKYEQIDKKTTRITGPEFIPINGKIKVKLEGAAFVGERYVGIVGVRDPYTIKNIDKVVAWARSQAAQDLDGEDYQIHYHIYGKNGVMGDLEPIKEIRSHELGIVVEAIAKTKALAKEAATIGSRQIFYARLPEVKGTAGTAAFLFDEVLPGTTGVAGVSLDTEPYNRGKPCNGSIRFTRDDHWQIILSCPEKRRINES